MGDLSGKVAIVTGAASQRGIGRAIALRLAQDGANVIVVDLAVPVQRMTSDWHGLDSVVAEIVALGRRGLAVRADLSRGEEIEQVVQTALVEFGQIDILVNNAGVRMNPNDTPAVDIEEADWERVIRCNLTAPFLLSKAVARAMIARGEGGKIVNIASVAGKRPLAGMAAYSASKAGLINLTALMALELGKHRIYVNAICPGGVNTDHYFAHVDALRKERALTSPEQREATVGLMSTRAALGRRGQPDEIANVASFLASDDASYLDGQAINVCGAWVLER